MTKKRCLLTVDLENAFNHIDRSCFLREARRVAPGLARCCDVCWLKQQFCPVQPREDPRGKEVYNRATPQRPLLFAPSLHGAISEGRAQAKAINGPVDMEPFYLDDGIARTENADFPQEMP